MILYRDTSLQLRSTILITAIIYFISLLKYSYLLRMLKSKLIDSFYSPVTIVVYDE